MAIVKDIISIFYAFSSGIVIAGAVFAFITMVGVVPRIAQKTNTESYMKYYEEVILFGGIFGGTSDFFKYYVHIGSFFTVIFSFCIGVFFGCLAVSLAEVLNVIPILSRRTQLQKGLTIFIISIALGKSLGSLAYFLLPGFISK